MGGAQLSLLLVLLAGAVAAPAEADPITFKAGHLTYTVDPATLQIDARDGESSIAIMPPLHPAEAVTPTRTVEGWRWSDAEGRTFGLSASGESLRLTMAAPHGATIDWPLPQVSAGTWLIPDGEGMAYPVDDPFWRGQHAHSHCMNTTAALSFPAWSYLNNTRTVTYALGDGLQSRLCLTDNNGLQTSLQHSFDEGAETLELLFAPGQAEPLAPALFYRKLMKARGQFKSLADKSVPKLSRLYDAPQAYVWGDGRDVAFLDDLKALGIRRINLSYDQDPDHNKAHLVTRAYLTRADRMGYLAGPYDTFDNGQPPDSEDAPYVHWSDTLYPSGCAHDAAGKEVAGFAGRGCEMSSEALIRAPGPFVPGTRYAAHLAEGATQIFVDVDAFGEFFHDDSPEHPMTMRRDRDNRATRLGLGIDRYKLVLGSENVTAWFTPYTHYSHGTAQAHVSAVWALRQGDKDHKRLGGYWPAERPAFFFKPFQPTPDEARLLFGAADRLPLFEAAFHDSVIAADRWEFGLMKVAGEERSRFAHALLYGTPTMWNLDRRELVRVGAWLKAAQDDFRIAHGWGPPVALTGFRWLSDDHLVQQTTFADGRVLTANFGPAAWQGLGPDCVRVKRPRRPALNLCPPPDPAPFQLNAKP
jgi:hypothetical protein